MPFTVEYPCTGHNGVSVTQKTNRYGNFATQGDAERWLEDNPIAGAKVVTAIRGGYVVGWRRPQETKTA
jgi:hypothetical protein